MKKKQERLIVETSSDTKRLHELQQRIAELERIVGQKQIEIDFKDKMIEIAEEMYSVDIKKSSELHFPVLRRTQERIPLLAEQDV